MNIHSINAPQLGEGIKHLKVLDYFKGQGDTVNKDEPILLVETEKASMEIESPVNGIVFELKAPLHQIIAIGQELMTIQLHDLPSEASLCDHSPKIVPGNSTYTDQPITDRQHSFIEKLRQSGQQIIPALVQTRINADRIRQLRKACRSQAARGNLVPSSTEIIAWCVLEAMKKHPRFRSTLLEDDKTVRQFASAAIGIAVSLPDDGLSLMRISEEECREFSDFSQIYKKRISEVRSGSDHNGAHSISISDMTAFHVELAVPIIVKPAIATLCVGNDPGQSGSQGTYILSLNFDHRLVNGVGAARFMTDIRKILEQFRLSTAETIQGRQISQHNVA